MTNDFPDKKRAILRAPLHVLLSIPFAAASLVVPKVGEKYVEWRDNAEEEDFIFGRDSAAKAKVDFVTQTWLVKKVLRLWGKR
jgi:hypothetical protein